MSTPRTFVAAVVAACAVAVPGAAAGSDDLSARSAEARAVAARFLRSINARRFETTCDLLSARFYRENDVPSRARCVLGLRIGFTWAPTYRFEIVAVHPSAELVIVQTLANGVPGRIVLVLEAGRLRVLSVRGA
jgi:hypothetical protein